MKSIKCPECGLQNWETAEWCKRCKTILKSNTQPNDARFSTAPNASNDANYGSSNFDYGNQQNYNTSGQKLYCDETNGFFAKSIRSCQRNLLIVCVATIAVFATGFAYNTNYLYNAVFGAKAMNQSDLLNISDKRNLIGKYVAITAEDVFDTGGQYVETSQKYSTETVKYKYVALQVGDKLLLAKVDPDSKAVDGATNVSLNGELNDFSSDEINKILAPIYKQQPELNGDFLPYLIDARSGYGNWAYILLGVGIVLTIICGGVSLSILKNYGNIQTNSCLKSLSDKGNPNEVAAMIDDEVSKNDGKFGSNYILPNWIIKKSLFSINAQHIENLVWVYKKTTKHSVNLIPTGKTHEVVLHSNNNISFNLNGSFMTEANVDELIAKIYSRVPWIVAGYDENISRIWTTNSNGFIQTVEDRKKSFKNDPNFQNAKV